MKRITALIVVVVLIAPSAHAQWAVHDPLNFAQAVIIAERTLYNTLVEQYETIVRMAGALARSIAIGFLGSTSPRTIRPAGSTAHPGCRG